MYIPYPCRAGTILGPFLLFMTNRTSTTTMEASTASFSPSTTRLFLEAFFVLLWWWCKFFLLPHDERFHIDTRP